MKVLKKGRLQRGWATEKICDGYGQGGGGCGAKLLVEEGDIYETTQGDGEGGRDYFRTFRCCECGVQSNFRTHDLPSPVWTRTSNCKEKAISSVLCNHANEVPNRCRCDSGCICKKFTCKPRR